MSNDFVVGAATVVIAITGVAYTWGTFRLLRATRNMFLLNFVLAYRDSQRRGQLPAIEEKRASALLNKLLLIAFPDELKELREGSIENEKAGPK